MRNYCFQKGELVNQNNSAFNCYCASYRHACARRMIGVKCGVLLKWWRRSDVWFIEVGQKVSDDKAACSLQRRQTSLHRRTGEPWPLQCEPEGTLMSTAACGTTSKWQTRGWKCLNYSVWYLYQSEYNVVLNILVNDTRKCTVVTVLQIITTAYYTQNDIHRSIKTDPWEAK